MWVDVDMEDKCVMCGRYVPEGTQVCNICKEEVESGAYKRKKSKSLLKRLCEIKAIYPILLIIFIIILINILLINKRGI